MLKQQSSFKGISNDNSVQRLSYGEQIQKMLRDQELQDDKNNSPKNRNQQHNAAATQESKQQYNKMVGDGLSR